MTLIFVYSEYVKTIKLLKNNAEDVAKRQRQKGAEVWDRNISLSFNIRGTWLPALKFCVGSMKLPS